MAMPDFSEIPARPPLRIRPMRREDLAEVAAIEALSFSLPWSEAVFRRELEEISHSHLPVVEGEVEEEMEGRGEILAYACWWEVADECHITNFAVASRARRRGVADFLLIGLLEEASRRGARRASLEVRMSNAGAIALYEKHGFTKAAIRPKYYPDNGEDALVMWKERI
ncbi:MAG: ribosomal protein S18-alanine N-acetyltransferase [bacterium]